MKRILLFLFLAATAMIVSNPAQSQIILQGTNASVDTLGASDTIYFKNTASMSGIGLTGKYAIEITAVSLSGTVTSTVTLEGSMLGGTTNSLWSTGINKTPGTNGQNCDTLVITAAGVYYMTIAPNAIHQAVSSSGVNQTYNTANPTRRYYIRLKILSGVAAQSTKYSVRLITQD